MAALSSVQGRGWIQEAYETGDPAIRKRTGALKKKGYRAKSFPMGEQVTQWGRVKMTMVDIRPGTSGDAYLESVPRANPAKRIKHAKQNPGLFEAIKPGSRVTIINRFGQKSTGKAVMRGPGGWVLNMGGRYGTPGIADPSNVVKVTGGGTRKEFLAAGNPSHRGTKKRLRKQLIRGIGSRGKRERLTGYKDFFKKHKPSKRVKAKAEKRSKNPLPVGKLVTVKARRRADGRVELYRAK